MRYGLTVRYFSVTIHDILLSERHFRLVPLLLRQNELLFLGQTCWLQLQFSWKGYEAGAAEAPFEAVAEASTKASVRSLWASLEASLGASVRASLEALLGASVKTLPEASLRGEATQGEASSEGRLKTEAQGEASSEARVKTEAQGEASSEVRVKTEAQGEASSEVRVKTEAQDEALCEARVKTEALEVECAAVKHRFFCPRLGLLFLRPRRHYP